MTPRLGIEKVKRWAPVVMILLTGLSLTVITGRTVIHGTPDFFPAFLDEIWIAVLILGSGIATTLVLAAYVASQASRSEVIEAEVRQQTAELGKARETLAASERRYRALYEGSVDALLILDESGFLDCNPAALDMFGYEDRDELLRLGPADISPPRQACGASSSVLAERRVAEAFRMQSIRFEWVHRRRDGSDFPAEVILNSITWEGRVLLQAVVRDITERKMEADRLRREHEELISIFDCADQPVYVSDPDTYEMVYTNDAFRRRWDYAPGKKCHEIIWGLSSPCEMCLNEHIFGENLGRTFVREYQNPVTSRWFRCMSKAIRWPDGRTLRYEMSIDISDQKEAQHALVESERKFRDLYDANPDALLLMDERGIFDCNPAALRMFGFGRADELSGVHPTDLSPPLQPGGGSSRAMARAKIRATIETGSQRFEWVHVRKDGGLFPAEVILQAVDMAGRPVIQAVVRDITERKAAEKELERRIAEETEAKRRLQVLVDNTTGRERRMIELKQEINDLRAELGRDPKYRAPAEAAGLAGASSQDGSSPEEFHA